MNNYCTEDQLRALKTSPEELKWVTRILSQFLRECLRVESFALKCIELKLWDKFMGDHLLKTFTIEMIMRVLLILVDSNVESYLEETLDLLQLTLGNNYIFRMWNKQENYGKYFDTFMALINFTHKLVQEQMKHSAWMRDYKGIEGFFDEVDRDPQLLDLYTKVSFLIKLREELSSKLVQQLDPPVLSVICRIIHHIVRFNQIYPMAVIPHKYLRTVCDNLKLSDRLRCPVPMMSIGDLKDSDTLKDFVANVKEIGFTSRQQFEEYLMTMLVLLNTEFDEQEYGEQRSDFTDYSPNIKSPFLFTDSQEQYVIRKTCFSSITELLVTIKEFPRIGLAAYNFIHTTRNDPIPVYMIHLKKLSEVLNTIPGCNPFEAPNLERDSSVPWNCSTQTRGFLEGQFNLPTIWHVLEEEKAAADSTSGGSSPGTDRNLCLRNCAYNLEWFEIDYNSSVKMVLEISMQIWETHGERYLSFLLPCLVRLTDLFVTRDQYKWLRDIVYSLHETVPHEDANCHQYIVYLMCKTNAVLVGSTSEVSHLAQTVIPGYLKSKSQAILIATLKGLLVLFESCVLNNSSIGGLNDEIQQLRKVIVGYADKCLGVEQGAKAVMPRGDDVGEYEDHQRVLWATVFYALEKTVKLIPDCPFMARVIVYLNRTLRETSNLQLFCGLVNVSIEDYREGECI